MVDVLSINDEEARQLSGEYSLVKAAKKIMAMGPKPHYQERRARRAAVHESRFSTPRRCRWKKYSTPPAPATPSRAASSATWPPPTTSASTMKRAVIHGSAMASFCVEKFGTERLLNLTKRNWKPAKPSLPTW